MSLVTINTTPVVSGSFNASVVSPTASIDILINNVNYCLKPTVNNNTFSASIVNGKCSAAPINNIFSGVSSLSPVMPVVPVGLAAVPTVVPASSIKGKFTNVKIEKTSDIESFTNSNLKCKHKY